MEPEIEDGYPTEETLIVIKEWDCVSKDAKLAMMEHVRKAWWMPSWGWREEDIGKRRGGGEAAASEPIGRRYNISTGGWSGNESLIAAMKANHMFWSLAWVQSRRGGSYIFEVTW